MNISPFKTLLILIVFVSFTESCKLKSSNAIQEIETIKTETVEITKEVPIVFREKFERKEIQQRLKNKLDQQEDLYVHIFVPLCDNEHQGIVPVNKSLGDGFNITTNLYWGAMYGVKTYFSRSSKWKLIYKEKLSDTILERVVFLWERPNQSNIYVTADAYRGDKMKNCLDDYFKAISENGNESLKIENYTVKTGKSSDLVAFNGHNGMMDVEINQQNDKNPINKDAVVIACASRSFFSPNLQVSGGYPLLTTTNLLAPEAYVIEAIITSWGNNKNGDEILHSAGAAYNEYQKCGINGAKRLFYTGW